MVCFVIYLDNNSYPYWVVDDPDRFKVMFSGVLEKEKEYTEFVAESQRNFQLVKMIVEANQASGVLRGGSSDLVALSAWGIIHGFVMLVFRAPKKRSQSMPWCW